MISNDKGFSQLETVLAVIVIALITTVGVYVYNSKNNKSKANNEITAEQINAETPTAPDGLVPTKEEQVQANNAEVQLDSEAKSLMARSASLKPGSSEFRTTTAKASSASTRSKMMRIAKTQIGIRENGIDNQGGPERYQYYTYRYHGDRCWHSAWCASFVTWVHRQATGSNSLNDCYIPYLKNQAGNRYHRNISDGGLRPGDIIFRDGAHTGIYVSGTRDKATTIEGNVGTPAGGRDSVTQKTRYYSYWSGGYIAL